MGQAGGGGTLANALTLVPPDLIPGGRGREAAGETRALPSKSQGPHRASLVSSPQRAGPSSPGVCSAGRGGLGAAPPPHLGGPGSCTCRWRCRFCRAPRSCPAPPRWAARTYPPPGGTCLPSRGRRWSRSSLWPLPRCSAGWQRSVGQARAGAWCTPTLSYSHPPLHTPSDIPTHSHTLPPTLAHSFRHTHPPSPLPLPSPLHVFTHPPMPPGTCSP